VSRLLSLTVTLLRDWTRNREAVFFALLFPLILLVIFSVVFAGGPTEFAVGVQNNDVDAAGEPTALSDTLVTALEDTGPLDVHEVDPETELSDTDNVEEATGYKRVLVIPDGFDERVRTESARVRMAVIQDTVALFDDELSESQREDVAAAQDAFEASRPEGSTAGPVRVTLLTVPDDEGAGAVGSIVDSVVATFNDRSIGVEEPTVAVSADERGQRDFAAADYFLPAFVVAMILINGVMTVPSAIAGFKRDGTLKRLAATPLRKHEWIVANVIQQSILAVAITMILIAVAWVVFGVSAVPGPLSIALIVLGAIAFTALGMTLGGVVQNPDAAISFGSAIALPLMFVSGIFWELDLMPPSLQTIAEFSPVTHFHRSLRKLMILDSTSGVGWTFAALGVLAVVFLAAAVHLTSWREFD